MKLILLSRKIYYQQFLASYGKQCLAFFLLFFCFKNLHAQRDTMRLVTIPLQVNTRIKLNGYVDMHTHPVAQFGFGEQLFYGGNDGNPSSALGSCNCIHNFVVPPFDGSCGQQNMFRNKLVDKTDEGNHAPVHAKLAGFPNFEAWPKHNSILHQQMWVDWINRAREGGLRIMVALAVSNHCMADAAETGGPNDDLRSMNRQIDEIKLLVGRHNNKSKPIGSVDNFMEIAYSAQDVRRIVGQNKLAVIIGTEMDNIGNFYAPADGKGGTYKANPSQQDFKTEIDRMFAMGVRYIFPIHVTNNAIGGAAIYVAQFNVANKYNTGKAFEVEAVNTTSTGINFKLTHPFTEIRQEINNPTITVLSQVGGIPPPGFEVIGGPTIPIAQAILSLAARILPPQIMPDVRANYPEYPDPGKGMGHRNTRGLTPFGMAAISYMMSKGMMIDIDHMSEKSATTALALGQLYKYPLNSGHNGFRTSEGGNENSRTADQVKKIVENGGMIGLGHGDNATNFVNNFHMGMKLTGGKQLAIGTDVNGLYSLPGPPAANLRIAETDPFNTIFMGNHTWNFNRDGVAHYGLLPAYVNSWTKAGLTAEERATFFSSAEYFAEMWEKCEDAAGRINKVGDKQEKTFMIPDMGVLCPTKLVSGDREFGGHGPAVTCNARLAVTADQQGIQLFIDYSAQETDNGDTRVVDSWSTRVYNAPGGTKISSINAADIAGSASFTSGGAGSEFGICHEGLVYDSKNGSMRMTGTLINSIIMTGDTGGADVSANPKDCSCDVNIKKITFNKVRVSLEPLR